MGEEGSFQGIKGAGNNKIAGKRVEAISGKDIKLTVDINIQSIAYHELNKSIKNIMLKLDLLLLLNQNLEIFLL